MILLQKAYGLVTMTWTTYEILYTYHAIIRDNQVQACRTSRQTHSFLQSSGDWLKVWTLELLENDK